MTQERPKGLTEDLVLRCECCGFTRRFASGEDAFRAGWDALPHFTTHVTCDLCPAVFVVARRMMTAENLQSHLEAHARWAQDGRPKEWSEKECL